jgi:hypothetical protein
MVPEKLKRSVTVIETGGERIFGRESIGNTYDGTSCFQSVTDTLRLFREDISAKETTAVKVKQYGRWTAGVPSTIDPHRHYGLLFVGERNIMIFNLKVGV